MRSRDRSLGERTSLPIGAEISFNRLTSLFLLYTMFSGPVLGCPLSGAVIQWRSVSD